MRSSLEAAGSVMNASVLDESVLSRLVSFAQTCQLVLVIPVLLLAYLAWFGWLFVRELFRGNLAYGRKH